MAVSLPRQVGSYTLLRPLDESGSGDVYLARSSDLGFDELCAVKVVTHGDPSFLAFHCYFSSHMFTA